MKKILSGFFLVLFLVGYGYAAGVEDLDGNNWINMDKLSKMSFAGGFLLGSSYVIKENTVLLPSSYNPEEASKLYFDGYIGGERKKLSRQEIDIMFLRVEASRNEKLRNYTIANMQSYDITEGLDKLYEKPKNRSIKVADAIYVVKKQTEGVSLNEIERILKYLLHDKKDISSLMVIDEKGKVVNVISFP